MKFWNQEVIFQVLWIHSISPYKKKVSKCTKTLDKDMEICALKAENSNAKFKKIPLQMNYRKSHNFCI